MKPRTTHVTYVSPRNGKQEIEPPEQCLPYHLQQPISILRYPLERLGRGLEKLTSRRIVLGVNFPEELPRPPWETRAEYDYPIHYFPERGFPLMYLAFEDMDHALGPVIKQQGTRVPGWIVCAYPDGLRALLEVYDAPLENDIVDILKDGMVGACMVMEVTVVTVCNGPSVKCVVKWMKHRILPEPFVPRQAPAGASVA